MLCAAVLDTDSSGALGAAEHGLTVTSTAFATAAYGENKFRCSCRVKFVAADHSLRQPAGVDIRRMCFYSTPLSCVASHAIFLSPVSTVAAASVC
jgi:hypothetical protein